MKADLNLKLQYTEVARSTKDGLPVIAMRHRVRDRAGAKHTTEWVYMEPVDARELLATLAVTVDELQQGVGGVGPKG